MYMCMCVYIHTQAAERLHEKTSGVEAAMQESHMQLSQRLSSAVQRVRALLFSYIPIISVGLFSRARAHTHSMQLALSEVRGVERNDLLKALLKALLKEVRERGKGGKPSSLIHLPN